MELGFYGSLSANHQSAAPPGGKQCVRREAQDTNGRLWQCSGPSERPRGGSPDPPHEPHPGVMHSHSYSHSLRLSHSHKTPTRVSSHGGSTTPCPTRGWQDTASPWLWLLLLHATRYTSALFKLCHLILF
ncbi:hypothetical protein E2C01_002773 [Portunus trituberculatus]|uniref:Uncharacterized protein n=1 Tax=Portunus trituberculatus TaxID=210409 RepID=A0A5B7CNE1_PORTR|nr:hypothetical protein [Portunus trituberculatus]